MKRISLILALLTLCGCTHNSLTPNPADSSKIDDVEFEGYTEFLEFDLARIISLSVKDLPARYHRKHPFWMGVIISKFDEIYSISFLGGVPYRGVVYETYVDGESFSVVGKDIATSKVERYLIQNKSNSLSSPLVPVVMTCDIETLRLVKLALAKWFEEFPDESYDGIKIATGFEGDMACAIFYDMNQLNQNGDYGKCVYELYFDMRDIRLIRIKNPNQPSEVLRQSKN